MKHWINRNYKTLIITAFLIPIMTVAIVSISHVTKWYGISNPVTWSAYLSVGIEIAALSALAAISANMGKKVYFPFIVVTLIQFIGNIFFAYSFIDIKSKSFTDWVDLVSPLVSFIGVEATDFVGHKRFLALFAGGMLPIISLSFLHMLVKFTEEDRVKENNEENAEKKVMDNLVNADIADEVARVKLSQTDLEILERYLANPNPPNDALVNAAKRYVETTEATQEEPVIEPVKETISKETQAAMLSEMMRLDQELGLYDEPVNDLTENTTEALPALSDEEVYLMNLDEYERNLDMDEDVEALTPLVEEEIVEVITPVEEEEVFEVITPTQEEEEINFNESTPTEIVDEFDGFVPEPFATPEEVQKYNIDNTVVDEGFTEINNDSFWRDHIQDQEDDLKKKI